MSQIIPIVMPKWGLSMQEGKVNEWLVEVGTQIEVGMPILDVETDKLANAVEAPDAGLLRRCLVQAGDVLPVKALLGVLADSSISDDEIEAFISAYTLPENDAGESGNDTPAFQYTDVDGYRIRYLKTGNGKQTVLLIHGFGGDLNNWLFNIDELAKQHTVIALDLPAHGGSEARIFDQPGLAALAAFVVRFLDQTGTGQVSLLAHSMGGGIAAQMALDFPERLRKLALVSPCGFGSEINMDYINGFIHAESRRDLKPVLGLLLADPEAVSRTMIDDTLKYKRLDGIDAALRTLRDALFTNGQQAAQPGLQLQPERHPLLVLWGGQDHIVPSAHADNVPSGAVIQRYAGSGHMCHMDHAAEVNEVLLRHFE